jgi:hypothetical protein
MQKLLPPKSPLYTGKQLPVNSAQQLIDGMNRQVHQTADLRRV